MVNLTLIHPGVAVADDEDEAYILYFRPTQNALPAASGTMRITVRARRGDTVVRFSVRHAYPHTLSTIWTVFNELRWPLPRKGVEVPAEPATSAWPPIPTVVGD